MNNIFLYTRSVEIIVSIMVGAFLSWLGYRLFNQGLSDKSDLKIEYGKIKFQIFSAAPGIFFTLFGAIIVFASLWKSATMKEEQLLSDGSKYLSTITKGIEPVAEMKLLEPQFSKAVYLHQEGNISEAKLLYIEILESVPVLGQVSNNLADIYHN